MKIFLLNPPGIPKFVRCRRWQGVAARGGTLYYSIWLAYATGVLESPFRKSIRLVDARAWTCSRKQVIKDFAKFKPDLIVVDTNFSSLTNDMNVASDLIRTAEPSKFFLVGPPCFQFCQARSSQQSNDAVARYEYDFASLECTNAIERRDGLKTVLALSSNEDELLRARLGSKGRRLVLQQFELKRSQAS